LYLVKQSEIVEELMIFMSCFSHICPARFPEFVDEIFPDKSVQSIYQMTKIVYSCP
jgi:hypothetical protein